MKSRHGQQVVKHLAHARCTVQDSYCILLAEDDGEMRALLTKAFRSRGFDVIECQNGIDLVERLSSYVISGKSEHFDLIISDVRMPGMTGLEVLESMYQWVGFPPMILITAFGDEETHARSRQLGALATFDKPFEVEHLVAKVQDILSLHSP